MWWKKTTPSPKTGNLWCSIPPVTQRLLDKRGGRGINFLMAIASLKYGKKMIKISWHEENSYLFEEGGILKHNKPYHKGQKKMGSGYPYVMDTNDVFDQDWVVV